MSHTAYVQKRYPLRRKVRDAYDILLLCGSLSAGLAMAIFTTALEWDTDDYTLGASVFAFFVSCGIAAACFLSLRWIRPVWYQRIGRIQLMTSGASMGIALRICGDVVLKWCIRHTAEQHGVAYYEDLSTPGRLAAALFACLFSALLLFLTVRRRELAMLKRARAQRRAET